MLQNNQKGYSKFLYPALCFYSMGECIGLQVRQEICIA